MGWTACAWIYVDPELGFAHVGAKVERGGIVRFVWTVRVEGEEYGGDYATADAAKRAALRKLTELRSAIGLTPIPTDAKKERVARRRIINGRR